MFLSVVWNWEAICHNVIHAYERSLCLFSVINYVPFVLETTYMHNKNIPRVWEGRVSQSPIG